MKEFIINLYKNEMFPVYLGIAIIVLLIAFIVVYFWGKKDQKIIEETQRLNLEKLKKESTESNDKKQIVEKKEELPKNTVAAQNVVAPKNTIVSESYKASEKAKPEMEPTPVPVVPVPQPEKEKIVIPEVQENVIKTSKVQNVIPNEEITIETKKDTVKEVNVDNFSNIADDIEKNLKDLEELTKKNIEKKQEVKKEETKAINNIYSSVYVNEEEKEDSYDETMNIELPKLKDDGPILKEESEDKLNI